MPHCLTLRSRNNLVEQYGTQSVVTKAARRFEILNEAYLRRRGPPKSYGTWAQDAAEYVTTDTAQEFCWEYLSHHQQSHAPLVGWKLRCKTKRHGSADPLTTGYKCRISESSRWGRFLADICTTKRKEPEWKRKATTYYVCQEQWYPSTSDNHAGSTEITWERVIYPIVPVPVKSTDKSK